MFTNYLKIAIRIIKNYKIYSFINIMGVAVSMAACFLILKYVAFEMSYDRFHTQYENLYRVTNDRYQEGTLIQHGVISYPSVAKAMEADYPEVVNYSRLIQFGRSYLQYGETGFDEALVFADSAFLSMFTFPLTIGDVKTALAEPNSILLSEQHAEKYFGNDWRLANPLEKTISLDGRTDLKVTGIFENVPENSHMEFDILISWKTLRERFGIRWDDSWTNSNFTAYLQLVPGTDPTTLEAKFTDFSDRYFKGDEVTGYDERFFLQPLKDIHLKSDYEYETWLHGSDTSVKALIIIAVFVLIIAWLNYVNLSTARAMDRAKEVGVRKVVGAARQQILKQFLVESLLFNVLGLLLAIGGVLLFQPTLSQMLSVHFASTWIPDRIGLVFVILFIVGTVASGIYPAFITSSFRTISVLKGKITRSGKGRQVRKLMVIFQFALSFILIAGTYTVFLQIDYMLNRDLGMNIDQTLVVRGPRLTGFDNNFFDNIGTFKTELLRHPPISHVTASGRLPGRRTGRIFNIRRSNSENDRRYTTSDVAVDYDFFRTFQMNLVAGRFLEFSDHNVNWNAIRSVVINESAFKFMGFSSAEEALEQPLEFWGKDWTIVGVVADHNQQSLHVPAEPIVFTPVYFTSGFFFLKTSTQELSQTIEFVKETYEDLFPGNSFSYFFLDEFFNAQYQNDQNFRTAFGLFASLGVLLACLGLFGLSFFMTVQRTKEIGVRKVMGATTPRVMTLLFKDFSKLVVLATLVASPFAYIAIKRWLAGYAYRINIDWTLLAFPGVIVLLVAVFTVSFQTVKAAKANPIDSIKYE